MLHDTFGFPIDLTVEIAEAAGHGVDIDGFNREMEAQRERARANVKGDAWGSFNNIWSELADTLPATLFCGYEDDVLEDARVLAIVRDGERVATAAAGEDVEVVLDRAPFYAEMGGQVGDTGTLAGEGLAATVSDTQTGAASTRFAPMSTRVRSPRARPSAPPSTIIAASCCAATIRRRIF